MTDPISQWDTVRSRTDHDIHPPAAKEKKHRTGGGSMNHGTVYVVECPECGNRGKNVAWHGHNCYYRCPGCSTVIELLG